MFSTLSLKSTKYGKSWELLLNTLASNYFSSNDMDKSSLSKAMEKYTKHNSLREIIFNASLLYQNKNEDLPKAR